MNIVFGMRSDYLTNKGGDTFQMLKTKEYLEQYEDIKVSIICFPNEINNRFDILHIFNLQTCNLTWSMLTVAKREGVRVVLSPIIWHFGDAGYVNKMMRLTHSVTIVGRCKSLSTIFEFISTHKQRKTKINILQNCDMVLPNSVEEGEILREQYGVNYKENVIPNCIDIDLKEEPQSISIPENFVLQVGRIEPTKNQISLLTAMMDHKEIPVVFVGKQNKRKKFYIQKLKQLADMRGNTFFIEELSQSQLTEYYKAAKVHVLPSFRESPGLVTLEALFYKCNIVVSNASYCPIKYYKFDQLGYICDPYSLDSIEKAVMSAYKNDLVEIPHGYFEYFSYKNAAELTRSAYLKVLGSKEQERQLV